MSQSPASGPSALEAIAKQSLDYMPSDKTLLETRKVVFAPIIGPSLVGKTTTIHDIASRHRDFGMVKGFTTRESRGTPEDEAAYRFLPHTEETFTRLLRMMQAGQLVQVAQHPTLGYLYGTEIQDWTMHPYALCDTLTTAVDHMSTLFGRTVRIGMVATPEDWWARFHERNMEPEDAQQRIQEGRLCLRWMLDQGDDLHWVNNANGLHEEALTNVIRIIRDDHPGDGHARAVGQALLESLDEAA